jgi:hypothetical protein
MTALIRRAPFGRRRHRRSPPKSLLLGAGVAAAGWLATYLSKRRRDVAKGVVHEATAPVRREDREYDDVTLARKVESELFRPADAPKGSVSVNVQHGVVELRGEVKRPEDVKSLGAATARIDGVKDVHNLLHTPGSPAKHSPPSDPAEVRERAKAKSER